LHKGRKIDREKEIGRKINKTGTWGESKKKSKQGVSHQKNEKRKNEVKKEKNREKEFRGGRTKKEARGDPENWGKKKGAKEKGDRSRKNG